MLDPSIEAFFEERKNNWLKKHMMDLSEDADLQNKKRECDELFSLENWLPKAANRAGQMSITTHPGKLSHPSAQITSIISSARKNVDGYLRSGNVDVEKDALGNAAVMDVYKFLNLIMKDSKRLIDHIQEDSELAVSLLTIKSESYEILKQGFLSMISPAMTEMVTSSKIKQIYFPVLDNYHQFSILSNSGMVFELKKRIDDLRFSERVIELREKKRANHYSEQSFLELTGLTTIGYGGTKPQNISVLNSQNGGKSYLLPSLPPILTPRTARFPKYDFFRESLLAHEYRQIFYALHKIFVTDCNNERVRKNRDSHLQELVDFIIRRAQEIRLRCIDQYRPQNSNLKFYQKIWLCDEYQQFRQENDDWLDELCKKISRWIISTYENLLSKQAYKFGEAERQYIENIVSSYKEIFR